MGIAEPGEDYMLNCTVAVVARLIVSPVITWTKRSVKNVISVPPVLMTVSDVMSSLYLRFSPLNTSDAGLYTCEASINVTQISMVAWNIDTSTLPLESKFIMIIVTNACIIIKYVLKLFTCMILLFLHYNVLHIKANG